jgi:hypothetical protein
VARGSSRTPPFGIIVHLRSPRENAGFRFAEAVSRRAPLAWSDEEIKPVLRLKRLEIAKFTEKHGVNLRWLLEGRGRIFKKDPIRLSPNMSGNEFAAVVAAMPQADQQAIRATIREILQERDQ